MNHKKEMETSQDTLSGLSMALNQDTETLMRLEIVGPEDRKKIKSGARYTKLRDETKGNVL